jgi:multidrug efflux system membrane fusion protein
MMRSIPRIGLGLALIFGCGGSHERQETHPADVPTTPSATIALRDTTVAVTYDAAGVADPIRRATLATKLQGNVVDVMVREGDRVARGQPLARIDTRDVDARRVQADAGIAAAEAVDQDAETQAGRLRALYADSAATRAQVDQVETALARAHAALGAARASRVELDAVGAYGTVRAPFSGVVTRRYVDPGAFVAPGTPVADVQDPSRLRVSVSVPPSVAATLRPGQVLPVSIEGHRVSGTIEGTVPAAAGAVYTANVLVDNARSGFLPGSAATVQIPAGERQAILIPDRAVVREGDLLGVRIVAGGRAELRWIKAVPSDSSMTEVLAGLRSGDTLLVAGE